MRRLMIIFVLGLLTISQIQSADEESSTDSTEATAESSTVITNSDPTASSVSDSAQSDTAGTVPPPTAPPQTAPPQTVPPQTVPPQTGPPQTGPPQTVPPQTVPPQTVPPQTGPPQTVPPLTGPQPTNAPIVPVTTEQTKPTSATTQNPVTTAQPLLEPVFTCDFTTDCFGNGALNIIDGSDFSNPPLTESSPPPPAPTSDAKSSKNCTKPYYPPINNGNSKTNWSVGYCYKNKCQGDNGEIACESGKYGLATLEPSQTSQTIVHSFNNNPSAAGNREQCLRFYYYLTVYNKKNWGQNIQLWIIPDNQTVSQSSIGNITFDEINDGNNWKKKHITFNTASSDYTLAIEFGVTEKNETIYFALDNIEVYDANCTYVENVLNPKNPTGSSDGPNLGLILGLSLGLGIPLLAAIIGGLIYYCKSRKPTKIAVQTKKPASSNTTTSAVATDIPLNPRRTPRVDNTVSV